MAKGLGAIYRVCVSRCRCPCRCQAAGLQHPGFNVSACPSVLSFDRSVSVHLSFVCFAAGLILLNFFVFFLFFYQKRTEHGRRISVLRRQNLFWVFYTFIFFSTSSCCLRCGAESVAPSKMGTLTFNCGCCYPTTSGRHCQDGRHKHKKLMQPDRIHES